MSASEAERLAAERLAAARRFARWHLGDESWADAVLGAYYHPDEAHQALDREGAEPELGAGA